MKKYLLGLCLMLSITVFFVACESDNNTIIDSVSSPNGEYTAYVFIRDMGATTEESYQLSIFKDNKKLGNSAGNAFVSDGEFTVKWIDDRTLFVDNNAAQIFKQKTKVSGVTINYENIKDK